MADVATFEKDPEYQFKFPEPGGGVSAPILGFNDVSFNYPKGPQLFNKLNFGIDLESRFAIVGPNGIGKSTLLNLISGTLEPTDGSVQRNSAVRKRTLRTMYLSHTKQIEKPDNVSSRAHVMVDISRIEKPKFKMEHALMYSCST